MFIFIGGVLYSMDPPMHIFGGSEPPTPPGIDAPAYEVAD